VKCFRYSSSEWCDLSIEFVRLRSICRCFILSGIESACDLKIRTLICQYGSGWTYTMEYTNKVFNKRVSNMNGCGLFEGSSNKELRDEILDIKDVIVSCINGPTISISYFIKSKAWNVNIIGCCVFTCTSFPNGQSLQILDEVWLHMRPWISIIILFRILVISLSSPIAVEWFCVIMFFLSDFGDIMI